MGRGGVGWGKYYWYYAVWSKYSIILVLHKYYAARAHLLTMPKNALQGELYLIINTILKYFLKRT